MKVADLLCQFWKDQVFHSCDKEVCFYSGACVCMHAFVCKDTFVHLSWGAEKNVPRHKNKANNITSEF